MLLLGTIGSIFDAVAKSLVQTAFSRGPAGSVTALTYTTNVLLVVMEALRLWRVPAGLEIFGFFLAVFGALCLVLRDQFNTLIECLVVARR